MISVDQIRQLQEKVQSAVEVIQKLRSENNILTTKLSGYEERIKELEVFIESYKRDQSSIEEGILDALKQLDALEDSTAVTAVSEEDDEIIADETEASGGEEVSEAAEPLESDNQPVENELDIF